MSIFHVRARRGDFSFAEFSGHPCLIWHRRHDAQHRRDMPFPADTEAFDLLCVNLARTKRFHRVHSSIKVGDRRAREKAIEVFGDMIEEVAFLSVHGDTPSTLPNEAQELNVPLCFDAIPNVHRFTWAGRLMAPVLLASCMRKLPEVVGTIDHPVFGEPEGVWLRPLEHPAPGTFSLLDLLDLFAVTPDSRTMLGVYTCGLFHADSLIQPRPVLVADSWVRGAGKSTLCQAIASLLDGVPTNIGSVRGERGYDEIVAHVTGGRRCLISANIDQVRDFQQENLVKFSTDGGCSFRRKHEADMTTVNGIAVMLNLVYGSASLHFDLVDRVWRAELTGRGIPGPRKLTSDAVARENRSSIVGHILAAHTAAALAEEVEVVTASRFHAFEAAGVRAWAHMSGESYDLINARLLEMQAARNALLMEAVASLNQAFPHAIQRMFQDLSVPCGNVTVATGARALGHVFDGTTWKETP